MASGYVLSPEARADITAIRDFYSNEAGPRVARFVLAEITRSFRRLAATPGLGHTREDLTGEQVKFWLVLSFLVVYDPSLRPLGIIRVLHASRDITPLLARSLPT